VGMYDYVGGEQIKIFYHPIFNLNKENPEQSSFWYSMGSLQSYGKEDELPLKTLWYQYPQNFLVYDYRFEHTDVWIIKEGKFDRLISYSELNEEDLVDAVYDYYGNPIIIKTLADFQQMKDDYNNRFEEIQAVHKEVFPNGYNVQFVRENPEEFDRLCAIKDEKVREVDEKYRKKRTWYPETPHKEEEAFGALIECYVFALTRKNDEPLKDIILPAKDFEGCKLMLQRILRETPNIVDRFKAWVNDDDLLEMYVFDALLENIQEPLQSSADTLIQEVIEEAVEVSSDDGGADGDGGVE
jgi:hypothetical protein